MDERELEDAMEHWVILPGVPARLIPARALMPEAAKRLPGLPAPYFAWPALEDAA